MKTWWISTVCNLIASVATAQADVLDAAQNSGSSRLANFVAATQLEQTSTPQALSLFLRSSAELGFNVLNPSGYKALLRDTYFGVRPIFYYDDNGNGGNPSEKLVLGEGVVIEFSPDSIAKEAIFIGPKIEFGSKLGYGRGRYLDANFGLSVSKDIKGGLDQSKGSVSVCSRNHVQDWTFIDICTSGNFDEKEFGKGISQRTSAELSFLKNVSHFPTEFKFGAYTFESASNSYPGFSAAILTAAPQGYSFRFGYEDGFLKTGGAGYDDTISFGLTAPIFGRRIQFSLSQSSSREKPILGKARLEEIKSFTITAPVTPKFSISIGISNTNSTLEFYDKEVVNLSVIAKRF